MSDAPLYEALELQHSRRLMRQELARMGVDTAPTVPEPEDEGLRPMRAIVMGLLAVSPLFLALVGWGVIVAVSAR